MWIIEERGGARKARARACVEDEHVCMNVCVSGWVGATVQINFDAAVRGSVFVCFCVFACVCVCRRVLVGCCRPLLQSLP